MTQHISMRLPTDEVGHAGRDGLLCDQIVREARERSSHEHEQRHRQELIAVASEEFVARRVSEHIDQRADEAKHRDFDQRHREPDNHQRDEKRPDLPAKARVIADQRRRGRRLVMRAKRIDAGLEEPEHGSVHLGNAVPLACERDERAALIEHWGDE